jgi:hypothetical protein
MTTGTYDLNKPFGVLDAAVSKYLPGFGGGWVDFRREEVIQQALVRYHLSQKQLGDLGTIEILALPDNRNRLTISGPPRPDGRPRTDEENAACRAIEDRTARIKAELAVLKKIDAEREELYRKRESHQTKVIALMFHWMHEDDLMLVEATGAAQSGVDEGNRPGQAAAKSSGFMLDFEKFVAGALLKLDPGRFRYERQALGPVVVYTVFHDNVAVGRIQTNADGTWEVGDAIPGGEHIDPDWRRIAGAIIREYDNALESQAKTDKWIKAYLERKGRAAGTGISNGKAKRRRGPSRDDLEACKQAMGYWLDDAKSIQEAADLAGIDRQTVKRWIRNVLQMVDQDTGERWTRVLKALGELD